MPETTITLHLPDELADAASRCAEAYGHPDVASWITALLRVSTHGVAEPAEPLSRAEEIELLRWRDSAR